MPDRQQLNLEVERLLLEKAWRTMLDQYIPMSVAAATTFHRVYGTTKAIVSRDDYDDALNIAAVALSRLVTVYTLDANKQRIAVEVHLLRDRFIHGGTQLRRSDGAVVEPLSVQRSDALSAASLIKRAGLPFAFALGPTDAPASEPAERSKSKRDTPG